jgi:hypothetical protein
VPEADQILKTLRSTRPRLLLGEQTLDQIRSRLQRDPHARRWYEAIRADAEGLLRREPSRYEIPDGRRLLSVSRQVKSRVETLGLVFLLEGDRRFADRLWRELEAAAGFKDWNPSHFLDTAEMTYGFAIGYDWLYDQWTDSQRRTLREAIVRLGLQPGLQVYARERGWHTGHNNWNQVCSGGLVLGALAVAEDEPGLAGRIVYHAVKSVPLAMAEYRPDGAGTEGVTYWSYGSRYNALMMVNFPLNQNTRRIRSSATTFAALALRSGKGSPGGCRRTGGAVGVWAWLRWRPGSTRGRLRKSGCPAIPARWMRRPRPA